MKEEALWNEVLIGKYGRGSNLEAHLISKPTDLALWRDLSKLWPNLLNNCSWDINNGERIRFWKDIWMPSHGKLEDHAIQGIQG